MEPNYQLIRFIRKQQKHTLKTLAKTTGIPYQKISSIENGSVTVKENYIKRIEQALKIDFSNNTEEDQAILSLFNEFYNMIFYGNLNTEPIKKQVNTFYEESLDSKVYYLVYLMKYVFEVLDNKDNLIEDTPLKDISFDLKAFHIYLIYKGVYLYEKKRFIDAETTLTSVLNEAVDEKLHCLASYQLLYVLIDLNKLDAALQLVKKTKQSFFELGAFIRVHKCNIHQAEIYARQHRFEHAIKQYKLCIKSALSMELPKSEINFVYRNIALAHIYNHSYEQALLYLDEAYSHDSKNESVIMYYLYVYYFTSDLKNFNIWLKKTKTTIRNSSNLKELDFWNAIAKKGFAPTSNSINKAIKVYEYYEKIHENEMIFFFLDIIVSLFEQINDEKNAVFYLKKHKNLLIQTQNS